MKTERSSWDIHVRDVFDQTRPRRTRFSQTQANKGDRRNLQIIDSTGVIDSNVLTSGMVNGMSNPAEPWFEYEPTEIELLEYGPVKDWIGMLEKLVRRILQASNAYEVLPIIYDDLVLAGTGCAIVEDDFEDVVRLSPFAWGEYCIALDERRKVSTLFRETSMSVIQTIGSFGIDNVSQTVRSLYDQSSYDAWIPVMHAIEPNLNRDTAKPDNKNMPFRSCYWERDNNEEDRWLRESGYPDNPIIAPRWSVVGNDVYGRSPGMDALGDMRQLQIQQKRKGEAIDKMLRPPTQGPASLADRFVNQLPGAHNTVSDSSNNGGIRPLFQFTPDINALVADIEDTRSRIHDAFFKNAILTISSMDGVQPRNQMEIAERKGEGLLILGPVVQRLQNELHIPLHTRILNRIIQVCTPAWQRGENTMLPPPPPELQSMPIQVTFVSAMAIAQKASGTSGIERLVATVSNPNVQAAFQGISDKIDKDALVEELAEDIGVAARIVRSADQVAVLAKQREQQQQQAQAAAAMPALADGASAAKDLSETQIGGGKTALETMLGNQDLPKPAQPSSQAA